MRAPDREQLVALLRDPYLEIGPGGPRYQDDGSIDIEVFVTPDMLAGLQASECEVSVVGA